jgi:queuine/archaeosine tRNA-ribosyltransferase
MMHELREAIAAGRLEEYVAEFYARLASGGSLLPEGE